MWRIDEKVTKVSNFTIEVMSFIKCSIFPCGHAIIVMLQCYSAGELLATVGMLYFVEQVHELLACSRVRKDCVGWPTTYAVCKKGVAALC
jgi:hypothetical protein